MDEQLPELEDLLERIVSVPEEFNETFRPLGWIAFDDMSLDAMEGALAAHRQGDVEGAEAILEAYYDADCIDFWLHEMYGLGCVGERRALIQAAYDDHCAGRYHSSVPVVLAQIDGICLNLTGKDFFTTKGRKDHLKAVETVVGDESGLPGLAGSLGKPRHKSSADILTIPYRHAIMHGVELHYDNHRTSTKAFAALIALRPWAEKVERGEQALVPPIDWIDPAEVSWGDVKRLFRKLVDDIAQESHNSTQPKGKSVLKAMWDDLNLIRP